VIPTRLVESAVKLVNGLKSRRQAIRVKIGLRKAGPIVTDLKIGDTVIHATTQETGSISAINEEYGCVVKIKFETTERWVGFNQVKKCNNSD